MRDVTFSRRGLEHLAWFIENDRKLAAKVMRLAAEAARDPFGGTGKPEPLKGDYAGHWSRRITDEHRLIYTVRQDSIRVVACRFHYGR